tara:strand:- start:249 stop:632 length:384 start_codon:yes stop_codon:yes gene_type:complete
MKLWKIALFALTVFAASCSIQKTSQPSVEITHVLAITQAGDTIALPMSAIRPVNYRVNYNYPIGYNYYGPWYSPNNVLIYGSRSTSGRSSNNSSNINKKITPPSNNKSMEKPRMPASEGVNINKGRN